MYIDMPDVCWYVDGCQEPSSIRIDPTNTLLSKTAMESVKPIVVPIITETMQSVTPTVVPSRSKVIAQKLTNSSPSATKIPYDAKRLSSDYLTDLKSKGYTGIALNDIKVLEYYGTVNNCELVYMVAGGIGYGSPAHITIEVAGYTINRPDTKADLIHAGGTFISISEAYEKGYLTKADVYEVGSKVDESFKENNPKP